MNAFIIDDGWLAAKGLQLGEVVDLEAQMFIRNPNVQFSTELAILPNCC